MIGDFVSQQTGTPANPKVDDTTGGLVVTLSAAQGAGFVPGTHVGSSALGKSLVVSEDPCTLRSAKALNNSGSDAWLMVFDAAALPANGVAPDRIPIPVPGGGVNGDVWAGGTSLEVGCVLALSSTLATLTLIAGDDAWFDAELG